MTHINLQKLIEVLNGLDLLIDLAWELSKNSELTEILDEVKHKIALIIRTVECCLNANL